MTKFELSMSFEQRLWENPSTKPLCHPANLLNKLSLECLGRFFIQHRRIPTSNSKIFSKKSANMQKHRHSSRSSEPFTFPAHEKRQSELFAKPNPQHSGILSKSDWFHPTQSKEWNIWHAGTCLIRNKESKETLTFKLNETVVWFRSKIVEIAPVGTHWTLYSSSNSKASEQSTQVSEKDSIKNEEKPVT